MFTVNEDLSIYATRGDAVILNVGADNNGVPYVFQPGDIVRMRIFEKKGCHCVVLLKDVVVSEATERVDISLTKEEAKFGELISKPKDYWYEIELNPDNDPQTIVGYDDNGPKVFRLFPEGADVNGDDLPDVYVPAVDDVLDAESTRPVQNKAIVAALNGLAESIENAEEAHAADINDLRAADTALERAIAELPAADDALDYNSTNPVQNQAVAKSIGALRESQYQTSERLTAIEADIAELKYVEIKINSISNTAGTSVAEKGRSFTGVKVNWTLNKDAVSQTADGKSVDASARSYTLDRVITKDNPSVTVTATDEKGTKATAKTSIAFYNGIYYGALADGATIDSAAILALNKSVQGSRTITFTETAGAGQRIAYALPTSGYGTPAFQDAETTFPAGMYLAKENLAFTNAYGYQENYNVWLSEEPGLGTVTIKVV